jgi:hypothetical protein
MTHVGSQRHKKNHMYIENMTKCKKIQDETNKNIPSGTQTSEPRSLMPYAAHTARLPELVKEIS